MLCLLAKVDSQQLGFDASTSQASSNGNGSGKEDSITVVVQECRSKATYGRSVMHSPCRSAAIVANPIHTQSMQTPKLIVILRLRMPVSNDARSQHVRGSCSIQGHTAAILQGAVHVVMGQQTGVERIRCYDSIAA